jgi:uncharacterized phiE125 gp8 family phage protein
LNVVLKTAPVLEPITLTELKLHLRLDSGSFADNVDETQSISPGSHIVAANYTTHIGTKVEVLGYTAIVVANFGVLTVGGVVDVKIQESDDNSTWTDWTGGAFTQVTISATASTQEKAYTGTKRYIRTVAKVITQASEFSTTVIRLAATTVEDDRLNRIIKSARREAETITRRQLLTATWYYYLDAFPDADFIKLPFGNLQSAGLVITYKDSDGTETTLTLTTDYLIETNGEGIGRIVLPYGESWPSDTLYPSNPITIEFACGWTAAASIPEDIIDAILFIAERNYYHGDRDAALNRAINSLLMTHRLWDEF